MSPPALRKRKIPEGFRSAQTQNKVPRQQELGNRRRQPLRSLRSSQREPEEAEEEPPATQRETEEHPPQEDNEGDEEQSQQARTQNIPSVETQNATRQSERVEEEEEDRETHRGQTQAGAKSRYDQAEPLEIRRANLRMLNLYAYLSMEAMVEEMRLLMEGQENEEADACRKRKEKRWKDFRSFKINHYTSSSFLSVEEANFESELENEARVVFDHANLAMVWNSLLKKPQHASAACFAWAANYLIKLAPIDVWRLEGTWMDTVLRLKTWAFIRNHTANSSVEEDVDKFFPTSVSQVFGRYNTEPWLTTIVREGLVRREEILKSNPNELREIYPWDDDAQAKLRLILVVQSKWIPTPALSKILENPAPPSTEQQCFIPFTVEQTGQFVGHFEAMPNEEISQVMEQVEPIPFSQIAPASDSQQDGNITQGSLSQGLRHPRTENEYGANVQNAVEGEAERHSGFVRIERLKLARKQRKKAEPWTDDEIEALEDGLNRVKGADWVGIIKIHGPTGTGRLARRTPMQCKDKARVERAKREDLRIELGVYQYACTYYRGDSMRRPWMPADESISLE
ncbi:uncharacterized protein VTP21DRAFT_9584 [Calcarisporiella thermophila]|uniref:uncharacterized protein n=1 Tax=Calcarisporiella thermophila TaxID=911321 RepID=UPI003743636E